MDNQLAQLDARIKVLEEAKSVKDVQQISYPLDDVSRKIIGEIIPEPVDATHLVLTGMIVPFANNPGLTDWKICDGSSLLKTDYPDLYAAIGVAWGSVDGTHFNVPDLRGKVLVGVGDATFTAIGQTGGEVTHSLSSAENGQHTHTLQSITYPSSGGGFYGFGYPAFSYGTVTTDASGSGTGHNNLQPYAVIQYYIKT